MHKLIHACGQARSAHLGVAQHLLVAGQQVGLGPSRRVVLRRRPPPAAATAAGQPAVLPTWLDVLLL